MDHPQEVTKVLDALLQGTRSALGDNLVSVYLRGSLGFRQAMRDTSTKLALVVVGVLAGFGAMLFGPVGAGIGGGLGGLIFGQVATERARPHLADGEPPSIK